VYPAAGGTPDYYEESCSGAEAYRFTVIAFGDNAEVATEFLTIRDESQRRKQRKETAATAA
jgi:hypothetical protein